MRNFTKTLLLAGAALAVAGPASAVDFSGKNINLVIGFGAGGGYDTNARLFAQHYGKHLPGNPNIVPQNMPGAGGLRAANYLYSVAPKDGTTIGMFTASNALEPLFDNPQAKFDTLKFTWIGNLNQDVTACGTWAKSGIKSYEDLKAKGASFGGSGPSAITTQHPLVLKNMLGLKIKVVQGYKGTKDINLAMQQGEVDGSCAMFVSNVRGPYKQSVESGDLKIIIQMGRKNQPEFGDAVNIYSLLKTDEDKRVADFIFRQIEIARPVAAPPGVPKDVADALRKGLDETVKDPALLADAKKMGLDFDAMNAAELTKLLEEFMSTPKEIIKRAQEVSTKN